MKRNNSNFQVSIPYDGKEEYATLIKRCEDYAHSLRSTAVENEMHYFFTSPFPEVIGCMKPTDEHLDDSQSTL